MLALIRVIIRVIIIINVYNKNGNNSCNYNFHSNSIYNDNDNNDNNCNIIARKNKVIWVQLDKSIKVIKKGVTKLKWMCKFTKVIVIIIMIMITI